MRGRKNYLAMWLDGRWEDTLEPVPRGVKTSKTELEEVIARRIGDQLQACLVEYLGPTRRTGYQIAVLGLNREADAISPHVKSAQRTRWNSDLSFPEDDPFLQLAPQRDLLRLRPTVGLNQRSSLFFQVIGYCGRNLSITPSSPQWPDPFAGFLKHGLLIPSDPSEHHNYPIFEHEIRTLLLELAATYEVNQPIITTLSELGFAALRSYSV